LRDCGVDRQNSRLRNEFQSEANEERDMKRMTKSWGDYLRKSGTQCAGRICGPARLHSQLAVAGTGDMTEFVDYSALLCHDQQ